MELLGLKWSDLDWIKRTLKFVIQVGLDPLLPAQLGDRALSPQSFQHNPKFLSGLFLSVKRMGLAFRRQPH